ncbi:MAG TPA: hypothetical protein VFX28_06995, partial [Methylomirabilota bacterium]|nr:hypothetical protein [Methylomirabilota bacterium]
MGQGTYVWAPSEGEPDVRAVYARCRRPANGHVVACERSYIHLNADRIVAWEYPVGAGGVLCVGAFVALGAPDRLLERHLRAVLANALLGEGIPSALRTGQARHWPPPPPPPGSPRQVLVVPDAPPLDGAFPDFDSPLHTTTHPDSDEPFTLAGRRLLVVGGERSGVREIWAHPWRILQDLHLEVGGETALVRDVEVMPGAVRRHLLGRQRVLSETVTTALDLAVALIEYRQERTGRARNVRAAPAITLRWAVDLRRMWPYPPADRRDVTYAVSPDARSLAVARPGYGGAVTVHASRPVEWRVHPDRRTAALRCELSAVLDEPLRLAVAGDASPDGAAAAVGRRGVTALTGQRRRHEQRLRDLLVRVVSPDDQFDRAFEWAKVRLDGFFIETPELGRSLAAGYAASRAGWGDGRPGYAWFFGRDACWTAFALLAAGDFSGARLVLRFLGRTQDVRGKVIHELTTS